MRYDSIIIGGGLAGLTSAIRCAEAGLKTAVISFGESSLTFASGAIDILGYHSDGSVVQSPFPAVAKLAESNPNHPYSKVGVDTLKQGLHRFCHHLDVAGVPMASQSEDNHWRTTALGSLRPAWLYQPGMMPLPIKQPAKGIQRIAIVNIAGFRDFQPSLAVAGLKQHPAFQQARITSKTITARELGLETRNPFELRSIELARALNHADNFQRLTNALGGAAGSSDLLIIPAVLEDSLGRSRIPELSQKIGCQIMEVASLPPSLPGLRIANALKRQFNKLGGMLIEGDLVEKGNFDNGRLVSIETHYNKDLPLYADHFVLASGSFFSKGLLSKQNRIIEPTFDLDVEAPSDRSLWASGKFLDSKAHHFIEYGVSCNQQLQPTRQGLPIENMYCVGSVLAGFNPVAEGSAGGVSIATGFHAAEQIIAAYQACAGN